MACISRALIIGGGLAGLASSIALQKAGVHCDVVETAAIPLGASLGLSGRATDALADLGVYQECYENGTPWLPGDTPNSLYDAQGRLISAGAGRPTWPGARTPLGIYRPVLIRILSEAAKRGGASIRVGVTMRTMDSSSDETLVTFTDGTQGTYDLIVGADGVSSSTRRLLFPDAVKPAHAGQMSIRWMAPGPPIYPEGWFISPLGRVGFYHLPGNIIYVPAVIDAPEGTWLEGEKLYLLFDRLLESITAPPIVELRRRLEPDAALIARPFEWILQPKPWFKGRALLLGDAAHATTAHMGQGGGMAMEDAVVLGRCIATAPTLEEALSQFVARRFDRVRIVVETSVAVSRLEQEDRPTSERMGLLRDAFAALAQPY